MLLKSKFRLFDRSMIAIPVWRRWVVL